MTSGTGIMGRLRESTRELHKEAESRPLQRSMARGTLPRGSYAMYLGQLRHLHAALEAALDSTVSNRTDMATLHTDERRRVPDLDRDLASFGVEPGSVPVLPATERFIERLDEFAQRDPVALLGPLYVLEGSTNGGRFLAKVLQRALLLEAGEGLSYMDPYGERQPEMWAEFKRLADSMPLTSGQSDAVQDAARETFAAIAAISDSILPPEAGAHESTS